MDGAAVVALEELIEIDLWTWSENRGCIIICRGS